MKEKITKKQLIEIIKDWGTKKNTSEEFSAWIEVSYLPLHKDIGIDEPLHTQKAMHSVMNAFDHFYAESIIPEGYHAAIDFILTSEKNFEDNESNFAQSCLKLKQNS